MQKGEVKRKLDNFSRNVSKKINPYLARAGIDLGALAGLAYGVEQLPDLSSPTMGVMGGITAAGLYAFDKYLAKPISNAIKKNPGWNKAKALGLAAMLGVSAYSLGDEAKNIRTDLDSIISEYKEDDKTNPQPKEVINPEKSREIVKNLPVENNYTLPDFSKVKLPKKESMLGKITRTERFAPHIDAVEEKWGIPEGYLAGLIMHESYGDPLQPNSGNDGGIGLIHTQGPTAEWLGLKIYGSSNSSRDVEHGQELKKMIEDCNYKLECVAEKDDRAHPIKNGDAIARMMVRAHSNYGTWDKAIQFVHTPKNIGKTRGLNYLRKVKGDINAYNNRIPEAEKLFNDLNKESGITWKEYQGAFHEMCEENFGLDEYLKTF